MTPAKAPNAYDKMFVISQEMSSASSEIVSAAAPVNLVNVSHNLDEPNPTSSVETVFEFDSTTSSMLGAISVAYSLNVSETLVNEPKKLMYVWLNKLLY